MLSRIFPSLLGALVIVGTMLPGQSALAMDQQKSAPQRKHHAKHAKKAPVHRMRHAAVIRTARPVEAPSAAPVAAAATGWLVTINGKASLSPSYLGASRYGGIAFPTVSIRRPGTPVIWSSPDDSLSYSVYEMARFSFGPVVAYRGGRYSDNGGGELYGIHKSRWTVEPGVFADLWVMPDILRVHAEVRRGFRDEDGFTGSIGADWVTKWDRFTFGVGPRFKFGNDHFLNQQFGITVQDALNNPRFTPFKAGSGLYAIGAYASATYQQSDAWSYTLHGGYDRMQEDAARSPIVKATGSRNQWMLGAIVSYTFAWGQ